MLKSLRSLFSTPAARAERDKSRGRGWDVWNGARAQRALEAASSKRWDRTPHFGPIGIEVSAGARNACNRARHVRNNDGNAANAVALYRTGGIGSGPTAASSHPDQATRQMLDDAFAAWSAKVGFPALLCTAVDELVTSGNGLLIMREDDEGALDPQLVPIEQLDETLTKELPNGRYIRDGIEFNHNDKPIAFHIFRDRPGAHFYAFAPPIRVPAEDVVHVFRRQGAGQHKGLTWFAPVLTAIHEHAQLHDALLVNAKIQSMLVAFFYDENGSGGAFPDAQSVTDGFANLSLEPGTGRVLPSGWRVDTTSPQQSNSAIAFTVVSLRAIAAGLQIPEFLLSGDMRGVNYSSARTALVQWRAHLDEIQHTIIVPALDKIYRRWLALESLSGRLNVELNESDFTVDWYFPRPEWIDPLKDSQAIRESIAAGLMSRRQAVASLGYNIERVDAEIAADRARESSLGLSFGVQPTATPSDEEEPDSKKKESDE